MRQVLSVFLAYSLCIMCCHQALATGRPQDKVKQTLKERVVGIAQGTVVEVGMLDRSKIRGKMGPVTDEGFALTALQGQQVAERKIAFSDVKSVRIPQKGAAPWFTFRGPTSRGLIVAGVTLGAIALVTAILLTSRGANN